MLLLTLAFRNILRQKRRSLLTILSMAGGYLLCCLSFSLTEGSYKNVIEIFTLDHTGHIQIHADDYLHRPSMHKAITDTVAQRQVILNQPDVSSLAPRVYAPALAYVGNKNTPVQVVGVDPLLERNTSRLADKVNAGHYLGAEADASGYSPAMLGMGAAASLQAKLGDELILISQGADGSIANDIYIVSALVGSRHGWDQNKVYLALPAAQEFLTLPRRVHQYALLLDKIDAVPATAKALQAVLPDLTINPWPEVEATFYQSMQADKRGNRFTLLIVVFIVFIGVLNTVLMSVLERTREFGVLKAIGSRPSTIASLILFETMMLAGISIVIGGLLATPVIAWFAWRGIALPEPIDMGGIAFGFMTGEVSLAVFAWPALVVLLFAAAVSIPPGIRATRIAPTQAMGSF